MIAEPRKPQWRVTPKMRDRARSLRDASTEAERVIWNALRAHRLEGAGFKRQAPIGPYIVDFVCRASNLIVEIDGGQHFEAKQLRSDARRSAFLMAQGYCVLRFNNYDVMTNRHGVIESIAAALAAAPSLTLPQRKGVHARLRRAMRGRGPQSPRGGPRALSGDIA